jgi:hypothetical protein
MWRWSNCGFFPAFFTDLGKSEDPMEGGSGVLPPQNCGGIYKERFEPTFDNKLVNLMPLFIR